MQQKNPGVLEHDSKGLQLSERATYSELENLVQKMRQKGLSETGISNFPALSLRPMKEYCNCVITLQKGSDEAIKKVALEFLLHSEGDVQEKQALMIYNLNLYGRTQIFPAIAQRLQQKFPKKLLNIVTEERRLGDVCIFQALCSKTCLLAAYLLKIPEPSLQQVEEKSYAPASAQTSHVEQQRCSMIVLAVKKAFPILPREIFRPINSSDPMTGIDDARFIVEVYLFIKDNLSACARSSFMRAALSIAVRRSCEPSIKHLCTCFFKENRVRDILLFPFRRAIVDDNFSLLERLIKEYRGKEVMKNHLDGTLLDSVFDELFALDSMDLPPIRALEMKKSLYTTFYSAFYREIPVCMAVFLHAAVRQDIVLLSAMILDCWEEDFAQYLDKNRVQKLFPQVKFVQNTQELAKSEKPTFLDLIAQVETPIPSIDPHKLRDYLLPYYDQFINPFFQDIFRNSSKYCNYTQHLFQKLQADNNLRQLWRALFLYFIQVNREKQIRAFGFTCCAFLFEHDIKLLLEMMSATKWIISLRKVCFTKLITFHVDFLSHIENTKSRQGINEFSKKFSSLKKIVFQEMEQCGLAACELAHLLPRLEEYSRKIRGFKEQHPNCLIPQKELQTSYLLIKALDSYQRTFLYNYSRSLREYSILGLLSDITALGSKTRTTQNRLITRKVEQELESLDAYVQSHLKPRLEVFNACIKKILPQKEEKNLEEKEDSLLPVEKKVKIPGYRRSSGSRRRTHKDSPNNSNKKLKRS
ncbi:MAG: hypothetical protein AAGI90_06895 [Chlamydiota bacterium]